MAKNIPNEVIVAELLNSVSIRAAAKKLELQERTIYQFKYILIAKKGRYGG